MSRDVPTMGEMVAEMRLLSRQVDSLVSELRIQAEKAAREDAAYRLAFSRAVLAAKASGPRVTNDEAAAHAEVETNDLRVNAKVAEALADANKQALLARRTQMSALQSIAASMREEMAFTRTGPTF